jgi:DNA-directed RNA polymerase
MYAWSWWFMLVENTADRREAHNRMRMLKARTCSGGSEPDDEETTRRRGGGGGQEGERLGARPNLNLFDSGQVPAPTMVSLLTARSPRRLSQHGQISQTMKCIRRVAKRDILAQQSCCRQRCAFRRSRKRSRREPAYTRIQQMALARKVSRYAHNYVANTLRTPCT